MNQKYFKLLPLFCLFVTLSFPTIGQTTLSSTDQALRYSIYARLGLKIIPIKLSDTSYKLQFVVEKIEEMEWKYLLITAEQNIFDKGYGKEAANNENNFLIS